ncbi:MAG TPA: ABC transporter transmembrane domain-containing protein, partial [Anaerolineae bacterium]|nr:ABC transporter transmembrane domain-containing protein [Anaerolineae bacterium]
MQQVFKLLRFVRPYWKTSVLALFLLVVVVILDLAIPRLVQRIIDQGIIAGNMQVVGRTFLLMLVISAFDTIFAIGNNIYSVQVGEGVARDLREALFVTIQSFSFGNLDRMKTGQLMVRLSSDANIFQRLVQISLRIGTRAPLIMLGSMLLMYNTDPRLALMLVPLLVVTLVLIVFFILKMGPLYLTLQQKLDRLNTVLQENIAGVRVVKAFVRDEHEARRFEVSNEDYTERNIRIMEWMATMGPTLSTCVNIGIVVVIWRGGLQVISGQLTTGEIVAFVNYLQTALGSLLIMGNLASVWAAGIASSKRVNELLETVPEVQDVPGAPALPETAQPRLLFENIGFHYNGTTETAVLDGITLAVDPGQTVAILG